MKRTSWSVGLSVTGDGVWVQLLADRTGLTGELSKALVRRSSTPGSPAPSGPSATHWSVTLSISALAEPTIGLGVPPWTKSSRESKPNSSTMSKTSGPTGAKSRKPPRPGSTGTTRTSALINWRCSTGRTRADTLRLPTRARRSRRGPTTPSSNPMPIQLARRRHRRLDARSVQVLGTP